MPSVRKAELELFANVLTDMKETHLSGMPIFRLKLHFNQWSTEGRRSMAVAEGFSPSATATAAKGI